MNLAQLGIAFTALCVVSLSAAVILELSKREAFARKLAAFGAMCYFGALAVIFLSMWRILA